MNASLDMLPYTESLKKLPTDGTHIVGYVENENIVVYQAFRNTIADYAVKHQCFGGPDYSFNRMSWIKTSFLWMMFRSGWAEKEGQERILAITLQKKHFDEILANSAFASFNDHAYQTIEHWKADLEAKEIRLQWDPDHDPFGNKTKRRAIQLGLKGNMLKQFGKSNIIKIEDISSFVAVQRAVVATGNLHQLMVPREEVYVPHDLSIAIKIGLTR